MLGSSESEKPVVPTGSLEEQFVEPSRTKKAKQPAWLLAKLLLAILMLVVVASCIFAPISYDVRQGKLTVLMAGAARSGGKLIYTLGPLGSLEFHTHKSPVNLYLDLEIDKSVLDSQTKLEPKKILGDIWQDVEADSYSKIKQFVVAKAIWLACFGTIVGFIVSVAANRRLLGTICISAVGGLLAFALVAGFVGYTYLTQNQQRKMTYTGVSKYLPALVDVVEQDSRSYEIPPGYFSDYARGSVVERRQANRLRQTPSYSVSDRVRILAGGDFHNNVDVGLTVFNGIFHGVWAPFDAVLLAGDMTQWGSEAEASGFAGRLKTGDKPVRVVGGNHDAAGAMQEFDEIGFPSLNMQVLELNGIKILGMDDPLAQTYAMNSDEKLLTENSQQLAELWDSLGPDKPQVILVHDIAQANDVAKLAEREKYPLTVIFGHDHKTSVKRKGMVTYVGCGTSGASGADGLGDDPGTLYTYQVLDFSTDDNHRLLSVVTLTYNGETRESTTQPTFFLK